MKSEREGERNERVKDLGMIVILGRNSNYTGYTSSTLLSSSNSPLFPSPSFLSHLLFHSLFLSLFPLSHSPFHIQISFSSFHRIFRGSHLTSSRFPFSLQFSYVKQVHGSILCVEESWRRKALCERRERNSFWKRKRRESKKGVDLAMTRESLSLAVLFTVRKGGKY